MKPFKTILIIILLIVGFCCRLYKVNAPVTDWHSFRQADTASVTKNFVTQGINMFVPTYHDLSNLQSGLENPKGYRMVEFPIYNFISTIFHKISRQEIDTSSRLVSIIFSLGSALLIYLICYWQTSLYIPSILSMAVFLFLPFNIYYSRTILPEPSSVFFMHLAIYLVPKNIIISAIFLSISALIKPYTLIITLPVFIFIIYKKYSKIINWQAIAKLILFTIICLLPIILWRNWITQFSEGIPKNEWLLNNSDSTTFPNWYRGYDLTFLNKLVAFRPHWFYWLFKERLATLILGTFGIIPFFLGFAFKKNNWQPFSFSLITGILLYFIIIAQGNIQHDYYQVLVIPFLSIPIGFGIYYIYKYLFNTRIQKITILLFLIVSSLYFSWHQVKGYYQTNNSSIIEAGQTAKSLLPQNSLVIAPYMGDTAFLYQTGHSGWPIEIYDIDKIRNNHPNKELYLISVNFDQYTNSLINKYPILIKKPNFVILKLSP